MSTQRLRAVGYMRLSDPRSETDTFPAREAKLRELAKRLGWDVVEIITENDVNPETGLPKPASAWKRRTRTLPNGKKLRFTWRPAFRRVLSMLDDGTVNALLAEDLDRLLRQPRDGEDLLDTMESTGAYADSLSGSVKFTAGGTDNERFMARILAAVAEKSSADTSRRVRQHREFLANNGKWGGGRRPYGFADDGLTIIGEEAAVIRRCARAILHGASLRGLARDLNAKQVPTVTGKAAWSAETLRDILIRERNAGRMVYRGEVIGSAPWKAIVTPAVHDKVKTTLTDKTRDTRAGTAPRWLGSGIFRCGVDGCEGTMQVTIGSRGVPRYRCAKSAHLSRNAQAVNEWVITVVLEYVKRPGTGMPELFAPVTAPQVDLAALADERTAILANLADAERGAVLDKTGLAKLSLPAAREAAAKRLSEIAAEELSAHGPNPDLVKLASSAKPREFWDALTLEAQRTILATVVDVVILPTGRQGRGFDRSSVSVTPKAQGTP